MHTSDVVKRQNSESYSVARTENHKLFSWSFPKVTGDIRCAFKESYCYQTSSTCFSNKIRQI